VFAYLKKKFKRFTARRVFSEYGYEVKTFSLPGLGQVHYAQWLHPLEGSKEITTRQLEFFKTHLKSGGLAIDIGAHTGDTTVPMALAAGKDGLVLGLEPNGYVFKILKKNAELNPQLTHIVPLPFAATDADGEFTFNYSDASFCNGGFLTEIKDTHHHHNYHLKVIGKNLEKFLNENYGQQLPKLQLIKVDAEGYDKEIIKTISTTIRKYKPTLLVECYKRLNVEERNELFDVISNLGYDLYRHEGFEKMEHTKIARNDMMMHPHFDMIAIPNSASSSTRT